MDLVYTNADREDVGVLHDYTFDLAFGSDENDFELVISSQNHCCEAGCIIYIDGTEYGGIIDKIGVVTKDEKLTYTGRTWHGMIAKKILEPDAGADYLTISGEANVAIRTLIDRIGLSDLFTVSSDNSGLTVRSYQFHRYADAYTGILKMLESVGGKLQFKFTGDSVVLSAVPAVDYTQDEEFDNDQVEMEVNKTFNRTNHLICLGTGDLAERQVVHLYMDATGNISEVQSLFGTDEITEVYDYSSVESIDELKKGGIEKLQELSASDSAKMNFSTEKTVYDIGDTVGARELITGIACAAKITKKIVKISAGTINIEYKVGNEI